MWRNSLLIVSPLSLIYKFRRNSPFQITGSIQFHNICLFHSSPDIPLPIAITLHRPCRTVNRGNFIYIRQPAQRTPSHQWWKVGRSLSFVDVRHCGRVVFFKSSVENHPTSNMVGGQNTLKVASNERWHRNGSGRVVILSLEWKICMKFVVEKFVKFASSRACVRLGRGEISSGRGEGLSRGKSVDVLPWNCGRNECRGTV